MNEDKEEINESIDLGDNIKLVYQKPEVFSNYHVIYHGQKYGNYYFRSSPATLLEKAKLLDSGYFIIQDYKIIGGVFLKPNFMSDLFIVPPYHDYEGIAGKLLKYLKDISKTNEKISLQEVVESHVSFYESKGYTIHEDGFWMIRPTQPMNAIIPDNYVSKSVSEEDKNEIADLIISAYKANPCFKDVDSKENYVKHVERFIKNNKDDEVIYNSSKIVVHKTTNKIVGSCLHMEFEGYPLIMSFAVRPDHQGKGIGSYLLRHSINYANHAYSAIRLYVYKHNPAINLYEHMGFIKSRTLNDMHLFNV
jgi:ribosomal protein S18 acetylase RimI-like enzyme